MSLHQSAFHAGGAYAFGKAIADNPDYREKCETQKRQRIESLLETRQDEFRAAGYWGKQAILKSIHRQVNREYSLAHCLF